MDILNVSHANISTQNRGGRGIQGMGTNEDDFVEHLLSTSTHDTYYSSRIKGKYTNRKVTTIPEYGRTAKGLPVVNIIRN